MIIKTPKRCHLTPIFLAARWTHPVLHLVFRRFAQWTLRPFILSFVV
jgi:hypothetical protein